MCMFRIFMHILSLCLCMFNVCMCIFNVRMFMFNSRMFICHVCAFTFMSIAVEQVWLCLFVCVCVFVYVPAQPLS